MKINLSRGHLPVTDGRTPPRHNGSKYFSLPCQHLRSAKTSIAVLDWSQTRIKGLHM